MKTITLQTYDLNKEKFDKINELSIIVRQTKNKVSQYIYNNCLYEVLNGYINNRYLYKVVQHLKPKTMFASTFQLLCSEVYTNYQNAKDNYFKFGKPKNNELDNIIRYITKITSSTESYQELVDKLNQMKDKTYGKNIILPRLNPLLYQYALNRQKQLILKSKPIKFINKGFDFKNVLTYKQNDLMFQLSHNKYTNAVVILKLDELITLPFRYSQDYHNNLINKEGGVTFRTTKDNKRVPQQRQYQVNIKPLINNEIQIGIAVESNEIIPNFEDITNENTLGVDVNLKRDIMTFDNTEGIHKNKKQIKKAIRVQKRIAKIQQTKVRQGKVKQKYGKKVKKTLEKNTRRNKYYNDLYAVELREYCIKNNIMNVVMEDLNLQTALNSIEKQFSIKYNNLSDILHINDLKNSIQRILTKTGINVHFVSAEYTSKTCPICGCIHTKNRKTQETFCCVRCEYEVDADINAARNIKERLTNDYYRENLEVYNDNHYEGKFKKHYKSNKVVYEEIYNFVLNNTNNGLSF